MAAIAFALAASCAPIESASNAENTTGKSTEKTADDNIGRNWTDQQWQHWRYLLEELEILEYHAALSAQHRPRDFVIRNVTLIDMASPTPLPGHSVYVVDGKIAALGPDIETPEGIHKIDGAGKFLMPGLTDMHVHNLESQSQHLLNIANGITTVRDLDGFPFLLAMRDAIANGELLAPTMYVSGTILNGSTFGGYALKIDTEEEAREAVRKHVALGYDFIKTHNSLSKEVFLAITDEAAAQNIDVVGHIPVPVSVREAVATGMRTFEHFKGYIDDSRLKLTEEDYVAATSGAEIWNTPTFTNYRNHLRGEDAREILDNEAEMQFVSPLLRKEWEMFGTEEPDAVTKLRQNIYPMSVEIFTNLRALDDAQFLAGTDSGSYEMMPPGIVLIEEVEIFERLGMTPFEALETTTVNAAKAMRREGDFGTIKIGARADLLLLANNPLQSTANLKSPDAVSLRGVWLDRTDLDAMLDELRTVYGRSTQRMAHNNATMAELDDFLVRINALDQNDFAFRDHYLDLAAGLFASLDREETTAELIAMKIDPAFGFDFYKFE